MVNILYKEEQRLRQNPLWLVILIAPTLFFWFVLSYQLVTGRLVGDHPISNLPLGILTGIYTVCSVYSLLFIKLTTVIYQDRIAYGWNIPTSDMNEIRLQDVEQARMIKYSFVGYGYRISFKYGTVYNVGGNKGLQIQKKSGEKVLIGTSREGELTELLNKLRFT